MEKIVLALGDFFRLITLNDIIFWSVLVLIILTLVYIFYLLRVESETREIKRTKEVKIEKKEREVKHTTSDDILRIVDKLQKEYKPETIDLTSYEEEQENTAIISYDELLSKVNSNINYDDKYQSKYDDLDIKKVVSNHSDTNEYVSLPKAVMMRYESEEDFLKALKKLQKNLVR